MKKILFLLLLMCSVSAFAQDVIVKKDGSTIVCRVVEVTQTEVIYKKWTDLQGSNYVMERANVSAINYEDGRKTSFGDTPAAQTQTQTQTPTSFSTNAQQQLSDDALMRMASTKAPLTTADKIKKLKRIGWTTGFTCVLTGVIGIIIPIASEDNEAYLIPASAILLVGGVTTTCVCLSRANKLKQSQYSVQSTPIFQHDLKFKNGASLATGIDFMQDNTHRNLTLGLGLSYHF